MRALKISRFSAKKSLYLRNDVRWSYNYWATSARTHVWSNRVISDNIELSSKVIYDTGNYRVPITSNIKSITFRLLKTVEIFLHQ